MPSRRSVLAVGGLAVASALSGCSMSRAQPKPVNVLLQNDDTRAWPVTIAVEDTNGEVVFRTAETVPADTGEDLGEVLVEDAFQARSGDRVTVRTWLDGDPAGTFDYELTCKSDNRFSLLVEHEPYDPDDGELVDYVPHRCGE